MKNWLIRYTENWRGEVVAFLVGALVPLAFAPFDFFPLIFFSIAVLFFLFESTQSVKRVFWRGYLFGVGYFGIGVTWVSISMVRFGGMNFILSVALTVLLVLVLSFYIAGIGYIARKFFSKASPLALLLLLFPSLWVLLEWIRGWLFTGFPWLDAGYSQVYSPLSAWFPVIGVYGVSLAITVVAGCLLAFLYATAKQQKILAIGLIGFVVLSVLLQFISWAEPEGKPLKASLIQGNIPQEIKWLPAQRQPTIDLYTQLTIDNWQSDIIIWPETSLPAYYHQAESFLKSLAIQADKKKSSMLIGLPSSKTVNGEKSYYNSAVVLDQGELQLYHKYHLVPFGEYIPMKWLLGDLLGFMNIPMANFKNSSKHQPVVNMAGLQAAVSICYEDVFGEEVINGLPEANFLINISNDAWFGDSLAPHQHLQKAQVRTLETARPMLRSTNNGISAVIDHQGNILATSPQFHQHVLTVNFQPTKGTTPYVVVGNYLMLAILLAMLITGWRKSR